MNIEDWLTWPTRSGDPGVNFVVLVGLLFLGILALTVGAMFLIPVLVVIGIAKGVHIYMSRPVPTDRLAIETQQRAVNANFPTTQHFWTGISIACSTAMAKTRQPITSSSPWTGRRKAYMTPRTCSTRSRQCRRPTP